MFEAEDLAKLFGNQENFNMLKSLLHTTGSQQQAAVKKDGQIKAK